MGCCKSRSPVPAASHQGKGKITYHEKVMPVPKHARPVPKDSWARLRDEAPLNPEAEPFYPPQPKRSTPELRERKQGKSEEMPRLGPGPPRDAAAADGAKPEWMQYLSQRLEGRESAHNKSPPQLAGNSKTSFVARTQRGGPDANMGGRSNVGGGLRPPRQPLPPVAPPECGGLAGDAVGGGFVLRTEEYKRLLRDGPDAKRWGPALSGGPQRLQAIVPRPIAPKTDMDTADGGNLTSMHLGKLWSNAFFTPEIPPSTSEKTTSPFLDDTLVEQMTLDRDLSMEAYWSDGGDGTPHSRSPSAHRFRRPATVRSYVMQDLSEELDESTAHLLGRVQRFNDALKEFGPEFASRRRFIIGLKEVFRRMKQGHIVALVVAPDIESTAGPGGLDDRMREVLAYAYQREVPVVFSLSRKRIGLALGKSLNISILGIVSGTGARALCDTTVELARVQRLAWLRRRE